MIFFQWRFGTIAKQFVARFIYAQNALFNNSFGTA